MKQKCGSCHGVTFDDQRGNCGACGAPRFDAPVSVSTEDKRRNGFVSNSFGKLLAPESAAGMNRAAQDLARAMDELNEAAEAQSIRIGNEIPPKMSQWIDALKTSS